jgi:tripartite-type tricarboxylate transporter receptor subunit TctC
MGKSSESRKSAVETRLVLPTNARTLRRRPVGVNASNLPRRRFLRLAAGTAGFPATNRLVWAQAYPARPITMIVPFAAGSAIDVIGRVVAERMRASLGKPIIIENATGADGNTGTGRAARAKPDGYTIIQGGNSTHVLNGAFYSLPYDVLRDFAPVSLVAAVPYVLFARKTMTARDLPEFIAWLKSNSNRASAGIPSANIRLVTTFFQKETGTKFTLVPYRTNPVQDLVAGQIDFAFMPPDRLPLVHAGDIKAYAVTSSTRIAAAPEIPTFAEMGLPAISLSTWLGLFAPNGTPRDIVRKLNGAAVEALADPAVRSRLADLGAEIFQREKQTPEALAAMQKADAEKWWPIIKELGISP